MRKPIYRVIKNDIKELIKSKQLKEGQAIPSENQLTLTYKVSRMTVRHALNNLVNEGYIVKHKGRGTFVSFRKIEKRLFGIRSFSEEMKAAGRKVFNEVNKFLIIRPSALIKDKLFLKPKEKAIYIERIRYGDDMPILFEKLHVPYNMFKDLTVEDMKNSFYKFIEKQGRKITHSLQIIEAQMPDSVTKKALKLPNNVPVLQITKNTFLDNGRPFEYVISSYRSDNYRFIQQATI